MKYLILLLAIIRWIFSAILRGMMVLLSYVVYPLVYPFQKAIRLNVYSYEDRQFEPLDDESKVFIGSKIPYYTKRDVSFTVYVVSKLAWLFMKDNGFDAGSTKWVGYELGGDNGQIPIATACWSQVGELADEYVVTNKWKHFMACWKYTGIRNGAYNFMEFHQKFFKDTSELKNIQVIYSTEEREDLYQYKRRRDMIENGTRLVVFDRGSIWTSMFLLTKYKMYNNRDILIKIGWSLRGHISATITSVKREDYEAGNWQ